MCGTGILDMLCQFSFKFGTYIIHVMIHVQVNLFCNWVNDGRLAAILYLKNVCIMEMICRFSIKFGTYTLNVRIHIHDNLFHNQMKEGRLAAILFFETVWYLGHALSVFFQI